LDGIKAHPAGKGWKRRGNESGQVQAGFSARHARTGDPIALLDGSDRPGGSCWNGLC